MKKFFEEFKKFITRGNVVDMAVGVIVGGAFTAIVNGLSNNILKPIINYVLFLILGKDSLSEIYTFLHKEMKDVLDEAGAVIGTEIDLAQSIYIDWGSFITAILNFFIIAFTLFVILRVAMKSNQLFAEAREKYGKEFKLSRAERKELKKMGKSPFDFDAVREYKLQKNDELELRIISLNPETALLFQQRSSSYFSGNSSSFTYRIYEDGTIDVPFLSKVEVAGLTLQQAEQKIEEELSGFADDIMVKLALSTGTFCVIGDAGRGYFPIYKDRLTIYQALALCGGISSSADYGNVKILRRTNEGTKILEFDIRPESVIDSEYYYVYPNDVIYFDTGVSSKIYSSTVSTGANS